MAQAESPQKIETPGPPGYFERARQPLASLLLLCPLILAHEGMAVWTQTHGVTGRVVARNWVLRFFESFGAVGDYLPGVAVVVTLLTWHLVQKDRVRPRVMDTPFMAGESLVLAMPLLVFSVAVGSTQAAMDAGIFISGQSVLYYFGVGIYEELIFRLLAIAVLHLVFVDLIHMPEKTGAIVSVLVSSVIFALAHYKPSAGSMLDFVQTGRFMLCFVGGMYLAAIYLLRGFGIAAATHAFFDVMTLFVPQLTESG